MADSWEWIFHLFRRHYCKSRIFERMEDFQNDCCRPWTKKPFENSYSRQLRIVIAVFTWSPAGQIGWPKSLFLQDKVTLFETMMTTMNEINGDKTKVPDYFSFVMFRLSVLPLNSMRKLIHKRRVHVSLLLKFYGCIPVCVERTIASFFLCFNPVFSVVQLWNCTKTIIRLRLSEYCRIIVK